MKARRSTARSPVANPAGAEQISLPMPAPKPKSRVADGTPEEAAKIAITRRAKPSVVPEHVKLVLTLELPRTVAERLSERAIRAQKNLEAVAIEVLKAGAK
jgi:hypothetical protein